MTSRASARHPASRSRGLALATDAASLGARGVTDVAGPHRAVALAIQAIRGNQRRTARSFARAYGLDVALVVEIEQGQVASAEIPSVLRVLTPFEVVEAAVRTSGQP